MKRIQSHTQQAMVEIDLTNLKSITESDWKSIVHTVPFMDDTSKNYVDYRDNKNLGRSNYVFKPNTCNTATESAMTMLKTLNFLNKRK